jgi:hypothetical protein
MFVNAYPVTDSGAGRGRQLVQPVKPALQQLAAEALRPPPRQIGGLVDRHL